jgi:hypothetical protein
VRFLIQAALTLVCAFSAMAKQPEIQETNQVNVSRTQGWIDGVDVVKTVIAGAVAMALEVPKSARITSEASSGPVKIEE